MTIVMSSGAVCKGIGRGRKKQHKCAELDLTAFIQMHSLAIHWLLQGYRFWNGF